MLSGSIDPIDLDVAAIINQDLSPAARSRMLAQAARDELASAEETNRQALGYVPAHTTAVDGGEGISEDQVRPGGTITYAFNLLPDVFAWIAEQLTIFAPVRSGLYKSSFLFFVDGVLTELGAILAGGNEFVFESSVPYAGKIEGEHKAPESRQAPNGVFEAVAALAQQKFPQVRISFSYRLPFAADAGVKDTPAITVTLD